MSLQFVFGNAGSGKSTYLYENVISESMKEKKKKFLVIVPEQFTMQTQRELVELHPNKAIMNIDVLSFNRLAYRVFDDLGKTDIVVLAEMGKNLILRKVALEKEDNLKVLKGNFKKIGYISELKSLISEMTQYRITPEKLEDVRDTQGISSSFALKLADIITMYRGFLDCKEGVCITAEEILELLASLSDQSALIKDSVLVLDGFTGFTPIQIQLLEVLFPLVSEVRVAVTIDEAVDPFTKPCMEELFYMSKKMTKELCDIAKRTHIMIADPIFMHHVTESGYSVRFREGSALAHLERNLFRTQARAFEKEADELTLWQAKTPREELSCVAAMIHRLVREEKYRYRDFAVVSGSTETYEHYLSEIFPVYKVPYFMDAKKNVTFHPLMECLRGLFDIFTKQYSVESVFHYLKSGLSGFCADEIALLENYVLARGIRGNKWKKSWDYIPKNWTLGERDTAEALRERLISELTPLEEILCKKDVKMKEAVRALYDFIASHGMEEKLLALSASLEAKGAFEEARTYEAVYPQVIELMDMLVELLGEEMTSPRELSELFDAGFETMGVGVIPTGYDRVLVGDIERTRLEHKKIVFFIGVNDGIIPAVGKTGGIISEIEREQFEKYEITLAPGARERAFIQKFYLYQNLSKPTDCLFVSYCRSNALGEAQNPSYLIQTLTELFPYNKISDKKPSDSEMLETPASLQSFFLDGIGTRLWEKEDTNWYTLLRLFTETSFENNEWEETLERAFKEHMPELMEGNIAKHLYGAVLQNNVTRLETYAKCAFMHFAKYGLRLAEREEYSFQADALGSVLHDAIRRYSLERANEVTNGKYPDARSAWLTLFDSQEKNDGKYPWEERVEACVADAVTDAGKSILTEEPDTAFMVERMTRIVKRTIWALTKQMAAGSFEPTGIEKSFGWSDLSDVFCVPLDSDCKMQLTGIIDRIDTYREDEDSYVKIIDYKSGKNKIDFSRLLAGEQLQLFVYLSAAIELEKLRLKKQGTHGKHNIHPGGIFYYHLDDPFVEASHEGESAIDEKLMRELKPDGYVIDDLHVIHEMDHELFLGEHELEEKGISKKEIPKMTSSVIPAGQNKGGALSKQSSSVLSEETFDALLDFTRKKITSLGREMIAGNVDPAPSQGACKYCDYRGVCGFDSKVEGFVKRELAKGDKEEILREMQTFSCE